LKVTSRTVLLIGLLAGATASVAGEEPVVKSVHQLEWEAHRDTPTSPDLLGKPGAPILPGRDGGTIETPCATVFGYLPYWCGSEHLDYDLLTHVACFGVHVNADGSLGNDHGWPWTGVINAAHQNGVKVVLVAVLFDPDAILTLITDPGYAYDFFVNIKAKMLEGHADGVNIDFEGGGAAWKAQINTFMTGLTSYLHDEVPGCEVTFAGPAVNWGGDWDLPGLAASCDGIFIMGYAFAGSWSTTSYPNAPLTGGNYNITNTILEQYAEVTQNNPEKLILGVPYYGNHWTTTSSEPRSPVIDYCGSTRFYNDQPNSEYYGLLWDDYSQTPWYRWHDGTSWHQVWFDNADSLGLKYDLAIAHSLQGVGMWALDYDGSRPELWEVLDEKFGGCSYCCDLDADGDVDIDDLLALQFCMAGPGSTYPAGHFCRNGDADGDEDVDLHDLAAFQRGFFGSW
jgi:spore germination protein YaaH